MNYISNNLYLNNIPDKNMSQYDLILLPGNRTCTTVKQVTIFITYVSYIHMPQWFSLRQ